MSFASMAVFFYKRFLKNFSNFNKFLIIGSILISTILNIFSMIYSFFRRVSAVSITSMMVFFISIGFLGSLSPVSAEAILGNIPSSVRPPVDYKPIVSEEQENVNIDTTNTGTTSWIQDLVSKVSADTVVIDKNKVLLIQDYLPWYSNANIEELDILKIPYDSINSISLPNVNLDNYKAIIITSDQPAGFYNIIRQHKTRWDTFVNNG